MTMTRPRDTLNIGGRRPVAGVSGVPAATRAIGFDNTVIQTFQGLPSTTAGAIGVYDPILILTVPAAVARAEVTALAVTGNPMGFFLNRCWWRLQIEAGGAQEFLVVSRLGTAAVLTDPTRTAGVRFTHYGSLLEPEPTHVELPQSAKLHVQVDTANIARAIGLTVYVRVAGLIYYEN